MPSFAGWFGLILFVIFAYNVLNMWQGATAVENATFSGGIGTIKALEL